MASSSLRTSSQLHHRYHYQMLPSKDDDALRAEHSLENTISNEADEQGREWRRDEDVPWKKQLVMDLRPSRHRDT